MAGAINSPGGLNLPGIGGLPPTLTIALLGEGETALTTVRGSAEQPFILVNDSRLPLTEAGVQPGDLVRVTRLPGGGDPRFSVARELPQGAPGAAEALPTILGQLSVLAGRQLPETLLPPGFPANAEAVRQLVSLFQEGDTLAPQLAKLTEALRAAGQTQHPAFQALSALTEQLMSLPLGDPAALAAALKALVQKRAPEARLEGATAEDLDAIAGGDLATLLKQLQSDPDLREALARSGQLDDFLEAARGLLDRLDGARAQQLHGGAQGYVYLDLPLPKEAGFRHAAAHFYSEGQAKGRGREGLPSVAVLDLDLTQLGPLWISIRALGETCRCEILAAAKETAGELEAAAPELGARLREAGYGQVQVQTGAWDGDRLSKTAALLATFRPLDVSA